jgi:hypothetical protein
VAMTGESESQVSMFKSVKFVGLGGTITLAFTRFGRTRAFVSIQNITLIISG